MKKKTVNEKISDELDVNYKEAKKKEIVETKNQETAIIQTNNIHANEDYNSVRRNLHDIIGKGNGAIDGILEVAAEGDSPRAYEVAAQMIKTVAEANKDLVDLHKKMKEICREENITNNNNTTNNAIYVGSTKDLQELLNQSRSASRRISNDDIIDVEIEENGN